MLGFGGHNHFVYEQGARKIDVHLEKEFYRKAVENLPICCVDIFVYNPIAQSYFLVFRRDEPAQGVWWYPGGRLFKGESPLTCAQRKCLQEVGLCITPHCVLHGYSTEFPRSVWGCDTHTVNLAVFATFAGYAQGNVSFDEHHSDYRWESIATIPQDPYLLAIYHQACSYIQQLNARNQDAIN